MDTNYIESSLPPLDREKFKVIHTVDLNENQFQNIDSFSALDSVLLSLISKTDDDAFSIASHRNQYVYALKFLPSTYSTQLFNKSVKSTLPSSGIHFYFITIHDEYGYDFTTEFIEVYNGKIDSETFELDCAKILYRAIVLTISDITTDILSPIIDKMLKTCNNDLQKSYEKIKICFKNIFPKLPGFPGRIDILQYNAQLTVGLENEMLSFWVRMNVPITLVSPATTNIPDQETRQSVSYEARIVFRYDIPLKNLTMTTLSSKDIEFSKHESLYLIVKPLKITISPTPPSSPDSRHRTKSSSTESSRAQSPRLSLPLKTERLANVEMFGWGLNNDYSLGSMTEGYSPLRPISLPMPAYLDPIKMIACSSSHTLMLTSSGTIYACGNNAEGALGFGDTTSRATLSPLVWSASVEVGGNFGGKGSRNVNIVKIAAGGGAIGSHSMAIDKDGALYGWGVAYALGLGVVKPCLSPTVIPIDEFDPESFRTERGVQLAEVSCGNCFTVAISRTGHVYSWGMWSHGRLGLGVAPSRDPNPIFRGSSNKQIPRYQLKPVRIQTIRGAIKVSCGDSHTMCLLKSGELYCWGKNSNGQIGIGPTSAGYLKDSPSPVRIKLGAVSSRESGPKLSSYPIVRTICAGSFHSLAIDQNSEVWSWGSKGGSCLGHGGSIVTNELWTQKIKSTFSPLLTSSPVMIPYELLSWVTSWSIPRKIEAFVNSNVPIIELAAGEEYSAFLSKDGAISVCGVSAVIPDFIPQQDPNSSSVGFNTYKVPTRLPPSMSPITCKRCIMMAGASNRIFALFDSESIAHTLGRQLLRRIRGVEGESLGDYLDTSLSDSDITESITDQIFNQPDGFTLLQSYGLADCLIIASGKVLAAHCAILSARSSGLRDMILKELPPDDTNDILHILLPELRADTATSLLYFLYTDSLPPSVMRKSAVVKGLQEIGKQLKIPRLQLLCQCLFAANTALELSRLGVTDEDDSMNHFLSDRPPLTLAKDLGSLVGDPQFSDIRFIAEGKSLHAHRFILEQRSDYFKAMFHSGMSESSTRSRLTRSKIIDVVVPDSYLAMFRMLTFAYTGILPDGDILVLLEDLIMADRYSIYGMKESCEGMIRLTKDTWIDILAVAELIHSDSLLSATKVFLRDNISLLTPLENKTEESSISEHNQVVNDIKERFPELVDEVFKMHKLVRTPPPSSLLIDRVISVTASKEQDQKKPRIPIWVLILLAGCVIIYQYVSSVIVLGWIVPVVNILAFIGVLVATFYFNAQ